MSSRYKVYGPYFLQRAKFKGQGHFAKVISQMWFFKQDSTMVPSFDKNQPGCHFKVNGQGHLWKQCDLDVFSFDKCHFSKIWFVSLRQKEERQWIIFSTFYSEQKHIWQTYNKSCILSFLVSVSLLTGISIGFTITWSLSKDWISAFKSFMSFCKICKLRSEIYSSLYRQPNI